MYYCTQWVMGVPSPSPSSLPSLSILLSSFSVVSFPLTSSLFLLPIRSFLPSFLPPFISVAMQLGHSFEENVNSLFGQSKWWTYRQAKGSGLSNLSCWGAAKGKGMRREEEGTENGPQREHGVSWAWVAHIQPSISMWGSAESFIRATCVELYSVVSTRKIQRWLDTVFLSSRCFLVVCVGEWTYAWEVFITLHCVHINNVLGTQQRSLCVAFSLSTKGGVTLELHLTDPILLFSFCRIQWGYLKWAYLHVKEASDHAWF